MEADPHFTHRSEHHTTKYTKPLNSWLKRKTAAALYEARTLLLRKFHTRIKEYRNPVNDWQDLEGNQRTRVELLLLTVGSVLISFPGGMSVRSEM